MSRYARLAIAALLVACEVPNSAGTGDGGVDGGDGGDPNDFASQICMHYAACMIQVDNCVTRYRSSMQSPACQSALLGASCSVLSEQNSVALAACAGM